MIRRYFILVFALVLGCTVSLAQPRKTIDRTVQTQEKKKTTKTNSSFAGSQSNGKYSNTKKQVQQSYFRITPQNVNFGSDGGTFQSARVHNVFPDKTFTVGGVSFTMKAVTGGTFTMGATSEQGSDAESDEKPAHRVTLSDYYIGQTEVTQALWQAVMGSNPSYFKGSNLPVEQVSWDDCQEFIRKLNSMTGQKFRLPTEAEWEYAARGGNKSKGYKYSGSNNIESVAWYDGNSSSRTHGVKTKQPNELGIYDMTGNVCEWCNDWYGDYNTNTQTDLRVLRVGSWFNNARYCRVSARDRSVPGLCSSILGLRLALDEETTADVPLNMDQQSQATTTPPLVNTSAGDKTFTVGGVSFTMKAVAGGTFTMGATSEQGSDAYSNEKPAHRVTLSDYYIGQTEVTQALWQAVMGSNPSKYKGSSLPVECVSWDDCQEFLRKLNSMTGQKFRLPTEAEWEYAARGGNKSKGYEYSGSNNIESVSWYTNNSSSSTHDVKTKQPNELDIYDMSGNVWEWCQDWYGSYSSSAQTNPTGPSKGSFRVNRGGGWNFDARSCRVSNRNSYSPDNRLINLGLRLALDEETTADVPLNMDQQSQATTTPPLANTSAGDKTFTVGGVSFTMKAVTGGTFTMGATSEQGSDVFDDEKPAHQVTLGDYYIGETEVTQALWQAVMGSNPSEFKGSNLPVEQVSWNDCQEFIRKLNSMTGQKFRLPTEAEWEYAARGGNKSKGYKYSGSNKIESVAWFCGNINKAFITYSQKHDVKTKLPNELGIYDMSGNVWEWCQDWYGDYSSDAQTNPTGPSTGSGRVNRGGGDLSFAGNCRVSRRTSTTSGDCHNGLGLRLALSR